MRRTFGLMTGIDSHLARARARGVDTYLRETERDKPGPRVFDVLGGEALETRSVPFGDVGTLFSGDGIECVWVRKLDEEIDPDWFQADVADLIVVLQGRLNVEFESDSHDDRVVGPGNVLVLPAGVRCRAYRWPRDASEATIFVATYATRS